jgi:uncharacterized protein (TIGR02265 family)
MLSHTSSGPESQVKSRPFGVGFRAVSSIERAIGLVAPHCDIVERLRVVPPSAQLRGVWIRNVEKQVERVGAMPAYREYFPHDRYSALSYYPMADFLVRLACAGALVTSPERVHDGMFLITKGNAESFMETILGRIMLRVLSRDPVRLLEQGMAARRQTFSYGHWEIRRHSDREVEVMYENEYWWIESGVAGAAVGTLEACNIAAKTETKLTDRFNGSTFFRW